MFDSNIAFNSLIYKALGPSNLWLVMPVCCEFYLSAILVGLSPMGRSKPPHNEAERT